MIRWFSLLPTPHFICQVLWKDQACPLGALPRLPRPSRRLRGAATTTLMAGSPPEPWPHTALSGEHCPLVLLKCCSTGHVGNTCGRGTESTVAKLGASFPGSGCSQVLGHWGTLDVPGAPAPPGHGSMHPRGHPLGAAGSAALFSLGSCPLGAGLQALTGWCPPHSPVAALTPGPQRVTVF